MNIFIRIRNWYRYVGRYIKFKDIICGLFHNKYYMNYNTGFPTIYKGKSWYSMICLICQRNVEVTKCGKIKFHKFVIPFIKIKKFFVNPYSNNEKMEDNFE